MTKKRRKLKTINKEVREKKIEDPNPESEDYIYDEVDKFHRTKDKLHLDQSRDDQTSEEEIEDEEVLAIPDGESDSEEGDDYSMDENENESEVDHDESNNENEFDDDDDNDDDLLGRGKDDKQDEKAWGKRKKDFYDADVQDDDVYASDEEAENAALEEEKEAMSIQKRMAEKLDAEDFYEIDENLVEESESKEDEQLISKDLSKLTKREKLELLSKESPELLPLLEDYKVKMNEVKETYNPLLQMCNQGYIKQEKVVKFIEAKHQLLLSYLVNISFYFGLKVSNENFQGHPIYDKLFQHRQLLLEMNNIDIELIRQYGEKLQQFKDGTLKLESIAIISEQEMGKETSKLIKNKKKKVRNTSSNIVNDVKNPNDVTEFESMTPIEYYNMIKLEKEKRKEEKQQKIGLEEEELETYDDEMDIDEKRQITYEMSKNKGLIRKRRKELKNPRVKHKMKFKKAKIKHKGQVPEVQKAMMRYGGELTGIKSNISRSVKIK